MLLNLKKVLKLFWGFLYDEIRKRKFAKGELMRNTILFNDNWKFTKEGKTENVNLPHTWNAVDGQGTTDYYRGECVYEKKFQKSDVVAEDGDKVYVEFRGVNSSAKVEVNGTEVVCHDGGYSTFRGEISSLLKEENVIRVFVDNSPNDRVYPQKADFTFYGGIYRDVYMISVNKAHFDLDYFGGNGFLVTPKLDGTKAEITFDAYVTEEVSKVEVEVFDKEATSLGKVILEKKDNKYTASMNLENIHRWDGLEDPYLYSAKAVAFRGEQESDSVETRFGLREYSFDPEKGFFLNGRSYPLHGVSRHQDRAGVGNALTKEMHEEDMELILSVGANSIRLAHYQHDQYFYDLCDEKGIVAWAEIPYITVHMPTGRENTISQMKELITQNYNHPSIICWAISNEISLQGVTDDLVENHKILNDIIHEMDPTRVSAMANLFMLDTNSPLVKLPDIRGYNLYYGWYVGEPEDNDEWFDNFHKEHPDVVIGLTEYGADSTIKLQSPKPEKGDFTEGYQAKYHEHMLEMLSTRPYIWGSYVWNMFEFAAAGRDEAGDPGKNHKGLITFDRKVKKDAYYIYKAWWTTDPFVHLCGSRYHDRVEETTEIKAYANVDAVKLFVDGKEVGEVASDNHVFKFEVPISNVHNIKAVAVVGGKVEESIFDEMEIEKVAEPNPEYFISADKVKNWFDEEEAFEEKEGYFSLNSTMAEISQNPAGKAILDKMNEAMTKKTAGGMGEGVEIPPEMQAIVARQPLKKLLVQAGIALDSDMAQQLNGALSQIKK